MTLTHAQFAEMRQRLDELAPELLKRTKGQIGKNVVSIAGDGIFLARVGFLMRDLDLMLTGHGHPAKINQGK